MSIEGEARMTKESGRWGSPNRVGVIYEATSWHNSHDGYRIKVGDLLLCLEQSGDAFYSWARLVKRAANDHKHYFNIEIVYRAYGVTGKEVLKDPLSEKDMKAALLSTHFQGTYAVIIPRSEKETEESLAQSCHCGWVNCLMR